MQYKITFFLWNKKIVFVILLSFFVYSIKSLCKRWKYHKEWSGSFLYAVLWILKNCCYWNINISSMYIICDIILYPVMFYYTSFWNNECHILCLCNKSFYRLIKWRLNKKKTKHFEYKIQNFKTSDIFIVCIF